MASITIRNLDKPIKEKLRIQAAEHGRSMEEKVRSILRETFAKEDGQPISQFDAQIAAIARSRGTGVVTRNDGDFSNCGVDVINPWNV